MLFAGKAKVSAHGSGLQMPADPTKENRAARSRRRVGLPGAEGVYAERAGRMDRERQQDRVPPATSTHRYPPTSARCSPSIAAS